MALSKPNLRFLQGERHEIGTTGEKGSFRELIIYRMSVFAPPGGGGELGRAGDCGGEDYGHKQKSQNGGLGRDKYHGICYLWDRVSERITVSSYEAQARDNLRHVFGWKFHSKQRRLADPRPDRRDAKTSVRSFDPQAIMSTRLKILALHGFAQVTILPASFSSSSG